MTRILVDVELENPHTRGARWSIRSVVVNTDSMLPCFAAADLERLGIERRERQQFIKADGSVIERWTGAVIIHAAGSTTVGDVIFGEPGDRVVLGWHTLSGLNRIVDATGERLIDGGPIVAASAA